MFNPDKDPGIPENTILIASDAFSLGKIFLTVRD
jgi:hypothetical protein